MHHHDDYTSLYVCCKPGAVFTFLDDSQRGPMKEGDLGWKCGRLKHKNVRDVTLISRVLNLISEF